MITADLARFVIIGTIPLLIWLGVDRLEPLYLLVFAAGAFTVVQQLADTAYLPSLVAGDQIMPANSKLGAAQYAAELSGQGIGGLLVAALTAPIAALVDALSFLFSGLAIAGIRAREPDPRDSAAADVRPRIRSEIAEGIRFVFRSRYLRALLGEAAT
jgi:hypothetical protein